MTLKQKIANRETELQRAYDLAKYNLEVAENRLAQLKSEADHLEDTILQQKGILQKCELRASEQGFDSSIFDNQ